MPNPGDDLLPSRPTTHPTSAENGAWRPEVAGTRLVDIVAGNTAVDMAMEQEKSLYFHDTAARDQKDAEEKRRCEDDPCSEVKLEKPKLPADTVVDLEDPSEGRNSDLHEEGSNGSTASVTPTSNISSVERLPTPHVSSPETFDESRDSSPSASLPTNTSISATASSPSPWTLSNVRLTPTSLYHTSQLRPGSRFTGTQRSDRQVYNVDVTIKHVSIPQSFLCGYLKIQGLTEEHHSLTTYFEGELIGTTHTFTTKNPTWGATEKTDQLHWDRFPAFKPLKHEAKKSGFTLKGWWNRENMFMRWKEMFLVSPQNPDELNGASYEGFYYICFNQVEGRISGIYFHAKSEK